MNGSHPAIISARAFGLYLPLGWPSPRDLLTLGTILLAGLAAGLLPAYRAYRLSLADGMMVRM
jgi:putative ABC transport system permease protein